MDSAPPIRMETIQIESPEPKKQRGLFLTPSALVVLGVCMAGVFAGVVLAAYFGRKCPECSGEQLEKKCVDLFCANQSWVSSRKPCFY